MTSHSVSDEITEQTELPIPVAPRAVMSFDTLDSISIIEETVTGVVDVETASNDGSQHNDHDDGFGPGTAYFK